MATTEITLTAFQTACAECADAISSGDYATAYGKYAKAAAILAGFPQEMDGGQSRLTHRQNLDLLKSALEAAQAAATRGGDKNRLITVGLKHGG